jgi:hypothetical protein
MRCCVIQEIGVEVFSMKIFGRSNLQRTARDGDTLCDVIPGVVPIDDTTPAVGLGNYRSCKRRIDRSW